MPTIDFRCWRHPKHRVMRITVATNNAHKLQEIQSMLGTEFELVTLRECGITEEIPEDEPTLEGNARQKARYVYERTGMDCFADDTGLEVDALNGAPGVHSARYATDEHNFEANNRLLLENLRCATSRKAHFRTVIALILGGKEYLFEGRVEGEILHDSQGEEGFGYDPLFSPDGYEKSFAQMTLDEKNRISHRGRAVQKLVEFLQNFNR